MIPTNKTAEEERMRSFGACGARSVGAAMGDPGLCAQADECDCAGFLHLGGWAGGGGGSVPPSKAELAGRGAEGTTCRDKIRVPAWEFTTRSVGSGVEKLRGDRGGDRHLLPVVQPAVRKGGHTSEEQHGLPAGLGPRGARP